MTNVIALYPEGEDLVPYVLNYLEAQKDDIEEIVAIVRLKNDPSRGIYLAHSSPAFDTLCAMAKLLDFQIHREILSEEIEDDDSETT